MGASISIIVPIYNQWGHTHQLLMDIYRNLPSTTEVIIVDDCSPDPQVGGGLDFWKSSMMKDRLKVYKNDTNLGFLRSSNFGVSKATNSVVVLMNNDVRIQDKLFAEKITEALEEHKVPTLIGATVYREDTGWNKFGEILFPYVAGWLLAFRKVDWDKFGGFDERYIPYDFEDVDISTAFLNGGGELKELPLSVTHLGAQSYSYSPAREAQTRINQNKFGEKWLKS